MPNKNYLNGKAKELRICKKLKEQGFDIAQRSAGSHSPIDVWAVNKRTRVIKLIQAKPKSLSDSARKKIEDDLRWLDGIFRVEFEVI